MSGGGGSGKKGGGSQVTGYRYLMGVHMGLGRGPVDELCEIKVGDRTAWAGSVTSSQTIYIDQPNLFGGEKKEGGIQGTLEVMMGESTQVAPPNLSSMLVGNMPTRVTVSGTEGAEGDGTYSLVTAASGEERYQRTIGGVIWQLSRQAFASIDDLLEAVVGAPGALRATKWQILRAGTVKYRTAGEFLTPESTSSWGKITLATGGYNWETGQYDIVESTTPVPGLHIASTYTSLPGFRRMVTAFFDGILSMNNPYPKAWAFRVRRSTKGWDGPVWYPQYATISMGAIKAMNPAHIIYECFTNREWGRGMSRDLIDDAGFLLVAQQLYAEGFGLCMRWLRSDSIDNFVQSVINHIGASTYTSRATGLITLRLIRGGYDIVDLPHFTQGTGLIRVTDAPVAGVGMGINEVKVTYRDPITNEDQTVKVSNLAAIQAAGGVINSTSREYKGVPTAELAQRLAQRDLRASSVNLRKFSITLDRRGRVIEPGSVFVVSDPSRGIPMTPVRAGSVQDGTLTNGEITINAVQDVFELPVQSWAVKVPNTWTPPNTTACLDVHHVFEVPYFVLAGRLRRADLAYVEESDGYLGTVCGQGKALNAGYRIAIRNGIFTPDDIPPNGDYFCGYTP